MKSNGIPAQVGRPLFSFHQGEKEVYHILCPASSLTDVPGYANPDKLMNVPIEFVCSVWLLSYVQVAKADWTQNLAACTKHNSVKMTGDSCKMCDRSSDINKPFGAHHH